MLTTLPALQLIPNLKAVNALWLQQVLAGADAAIKSWCKRDLEWTSYPGCAINGKGDSGFYSGLNSQSIAVRQYPLLNPQTTIASGSNNVALPTGTINVGSTTGFYPYGGTLAIVTDAANQASTAVTYTGLTSTTFTGCSGGSGMLATGQSVGSIAVWFNQQGFGGQAPNAFNSETMLTQGIGYYVVLTRSQSGTNTGGSGLIQRAYGQALFGACGMGYYGDGYDAKLSARRLPCWPQGMQNVKVSYQAGYMVVPADLAYACQLLVEQMIRMLPVGGNLSEEHIGSYGYSLLAQMANKSIPDVGGLARVLSLYRDWTGGSN